MGTDTGVGLVHHHQAGTRAGKAVAALIGLDVVEADNREGWASKRVCDAGRPRSKRAQRRQ